MFVPVLILSDTLLTKLPSHLASINALFAQRKAEIRRIFRAIAWWSARRTFEVCAGTYNGLHGDLKQSPRRPRRPSAEIRRGSGELRRECTQLRGGDAQLTYNAIKRRWHWPFYKKEWLFLQHGQDTNTLYLSRQHLPLTGCKRCHAKDDG